MPAAAVGDPSEIEFRADDVVFLCMKGQHTEDAVRALAADAPTEHRVVSVQNGVANEPTALRYFAGVYGMCVMCPAVHLEPGIVEASSAPVSGILDIGCYPARRRRARQGGERGRRRCDVPLRPARPTSCAGSTGSS